MTCCWPHIISAAAGLNLRWEDANGWGSRSEESGVQKSGKDAEMDEEAWERTGSHKGVMDSRNLRV